MELVSASGQRWTWAAAGAFAATGHPRPTRFRGCRRRRAAQGHGQHLAFDHAHAAPLRGQHPHDQGLGILHEDIPGRLRVGAAPEGHQGLLPAKRGSAADGPTSASPSVALSSPGFHSGAEAKAPMITPAQGCRLPTKI